MKTIIAACIIGSVLLAYAGGGSIDNPQARHDREVASVMATNVTLDALLIEAQAANNATKLQAVVLKILGRQQAEEKAKKDSKDKAKKNPPKGK